MLHSSDECAHLNRLSRRSPAEKGIFSLGMLLLALLLPPLPAAPVIMSIVLVALLGVARVPLRALVSFLAAPLIFIAVSGATLAVSLTADLHPVITPEGLRHAVEVTLRATACVCSVSFLALTTPITALLPALRRWRVPASLVELSLLIYRFLFAFTDTLCAMHTAQAARLGHATRKSAFRSTGMLVATLFIRALDRARHMENGLAARGWEGELRVLGNDKPCSPAICALILLGQVGLGVVLWVVRIV